VTSTPPTRIEPLSAWSMPATRFKSVVLPEPEGPMSARNSPSGMEMERRWRIGSTWSPRR